MNHEQRIAALILEAERHKARLDAMNAQIEGDPAAWLQVTMKMSETVAEVYIDKVLAEARQTALALAGIVKTIEALEAVSEPAAPAAKAEDPADQVAQRRAEKLKNAQASGI